MAACVYVWLLFLLPHARAHWLSSWIGLDRIGSRDAKTGVELVGTRRLLSKRSGELEAERSTPHSESLEDRIKRLEETQEKKNKEFSKILKGDPPTEPPDPNGLPDRAPNVKANETPAFDAHPKGLDDFGDLGDKIEADQEKAKDDLRVARAEAAMGGNVLWQGRPKGPPEWGIIFQPPDPNPVYGDEPIPTANEWTGDKKELEKRNEDQTKAIEAMESRTSKNVDSVKKLYEETKTEAKRESDKETEEVNKLTRLVNEYKSNMHTMQESAKKNPLLYLHKWKSQNEKFILDLDRGNAANEEGLALSQEVFAQGHAAERENQRLARSTLSNEVNRIFNDLLPSIQTRLRSMYGDFSARTAEGRDLFENNFMRDFNKTIKLRAETINQLDAAIQGQEARATQYAEKVKDAGSLLAASHDVLREKFQAAKDETRQDATKHKEKISADAEKDAELLFEVEKQFFDSAEAESTAGTEALDELISTWMMESLKAPKEPDKAFARLREKIKTWLEEIEAVHGKAVSAMSAKEGKVSTMEEAESRSLDSFDGVFEQEEKVMDKQAAAAQAALNATKRSTAKTEEMRLDSLFDQLSFRLRGAEKGRKAMVASGEAGLTALKEHSEYQLKEAKKVLDRLERRFKVKLTTEKAWYAKQAADNAGRFVEQNSSYHETDRAFERGQKEEYIKRRDVRLRIDLTRESLRQLVEEARRVVVAGNLTESAATWANRTVPAFSGRATRGVVLLRGAGAGLNATYAADAGAALTKRVAGLGHLEKNWETNADRVGKRLRETSWLAAQEGTNAGEAGQVVGRLGPYMKKVIAQALEALQSQRAASRAGVKAAVPRIGSGVRAQMATDRSRRTDELFRLSSEEKRRIGAFGEKIDVAGSALQGQVGIVGRRIGDLESQTAGASSSAGAAANAARNAGTKAREQIAAQSAKDEARTSSAGAAVRAGEARAKAGFAAKDTQHSALAAELGANFGAFARYELPRVEQQTAAQRGSAEKDLKNWEGLIGAEIQRLAGVTMMVGTEIGQFGIDSHFVEERALDEFQGVDKQLKRSLDNADANRKAVADKSEIGFTKLGGSLEGDLASMNGNGEGAVQNMKKKERVDAAIAAAEDQAATDEVDEEMKATRKRLAEDEEARLREVIGNHAVMEKFDDQNYKATEKHLKALKAAEALMAHVVEMQKTSLALSTGEGKSQTAAIDSGVLQAIAALRQVWANEKAKRDAAKGKLEKERSTFSQSLSGEIRHARTNVALAQSINAKVAQLDAAHRAWADNKLTALSAKLGQVSEAGQREYQDIQVALAHKNSLSGLAKTGAAELASDIGAALDQARLTASHVIADRKAAMAAERARFDASLTSLDAGSAADRNTAGYLRKLLAP